MWVLDNLKEKFTSGNDIEVERATITRWEYEALLDYIEFVNDTSRRKYEKS